MSRKTAVTSFFVLCGLLVAAAPAFGQGVQFQVSSLPQQARFEGLTETMGAVVVQATAAGTIPSGSSITVLYSGTISSPVSGQASVGTCTAGTNCVLSGAFGGAPVASGGVTGTSVTVNGNALTIAFTAAKGFALGDNLVISQVRVNVNAQGSSVSSVTATLSGTSAAPTTNPITFTNATVPVASVVNPSLTVARITNGGNIQTCSIPGGGVKSAVGVVERYPAALTTAVDEGGVSGPSGFTPSFAVANGTTVNVSLAGIPSGLAVNLTGVAYATSTITSLTVTASPAIGAAQTSTGAAINYTFTVTGDSTAVVENVNFVFFFGLPGSTAGTLSATSGSLPAIGTTASIVATVSLGPVQASPVVAFAANTQGTTTLATVSDCVTNILFPYITNQGGYDTSFSLANTTSDKLAFGAGNGAAPQSGTCTLSFWPTTDVTQGTTGTALTFNTPNVPTGAVYAFSQSGTSFANQTGYMIAVCRFLNAHGFAFITNGYAVSTGPRISSGYLGLIIPNPVGGRTNVNGEVLLN